MRNGLSVDSWMLNLKVGREWDQPLPEVHDIPQAMFGLESYVKRVEALVISKESDAAPQHVGVWGMGGVGKTLLLQRVDESPNVKGHFQGAEFIWLTVGQTPDIMALYRTVSKKMHLDPELHVNPEDYKRYLHTHFRQKRVFLVLDDVWEDKAFESLDLAKGRGSVTLLSTRNQSLLDRASPYISQEHMTPLSKEDSWSLFCVYAFRPPSHVPCELKALALSMAEECQGLPLALKVIGRAMFGETLPGQWKLLLKRRRESRMQEGTVEEGLYERLKLGYDLLSEDDERLKDCFLYFAAFPEDDQIAFDEILWGWIGEGLVPRNGGDDPRADAVSLLQKLWKRSFIEIELNVKISGGKGVRWCKLHDVMRDLAFYILEKESGTSPAKQLYLYRSGQNLKEFPQEWQVISKARRLSLRRNNLKTLPRRFCAPDLLSLLLGENPIVSLPGSFLWKCGKLRVLDLSQGNFWNLPEELGNLKNLVWLHLSGCHNLEILPDAVRNLHLLKCLDLRSCRKLKYLPEELGNLKNLVWLHLSDCHNLEILPDAVRNLHLLKCLDLRFCWRLKYLPEQLGDLTNLVRLKLFDCNNLEVLPDTIRKLHVLKCLDVGYCHKLKYLPSGIVNLTSLQKLFTNGCDNLTWAEHTPASMATAESLCHVYPTVGASLEDICRLGVLTKLSIFVGENPEVELPHNICTLANLKFLELALGNVKVLPAGMSYCFRQLQTLRLFGLYNLEYLPNSFTCCGAFPALIEFEITGCSSLVEFPEVDEGALPKLGTLYVEECDSLETLPLSLEVLTSLTSLILCNCEKILEKSCRMNCEKSSKWRRFLLIK
jgi:Leucine-rich repeat (LRR) protein